MFGDLFEFYLKRDLGRQLINRLPFSGFLALLSYFSISYFIPQYSFGVTSFAIIVAALLAFLISSSLLGKDFSRTLSDGIFKVDYRPFVAKMQAINEGRDSVFSDLDKMGAKRKIVWVGGTCGVSLTVFLSGMFLLALTYAHPPVIATEAGALLLTLYVFYEIVNAPVLNREEEDQKQTAPLDLYEQYTVKNTLPHLPFRSKSLLFAAMQFFAPVTHVDVPHFAFEATLVYVNPKLDEELLRLTDSSRTAVCLKREDGMEMRPLVEGPDFPLEKITVMNEKSPKEVFSYLLDPDYKYSDQERRKWGAFGAVDSSENKTLARIFLHKFSALASKSRLKKNGEDTKLVFIRTKAIQFILIGERGYVQYLKTRIESLSVKVPRDLQNMEYDIRPER